MDSPEQSWQRGLLNVTDSELDAYICGNHQTPMMWELALHERAARAIKELTKETKRSGTLMLWFTVAILAATLALVWIALSTDEHVKLIHKMAEQQNGLKTHQTPNPQKAGVSK